MDKKMWKEWEKEDYKKLRELGYKKISKHHYSKIDLVNFVFVRIDIYRFCDDVRLEVTYKWRGVRCKFSYARDFLFEIFENEKKWIYNFLKLLTTE